MHDNLNNAGTRQQGRDFDQIMDQVDKLSLGLTREQRAKILEKLESIVNYVPKVGVFGKTGAGKSSLCNALFGSKICEVSDIASCTQNPQEVILQMGERGQITVIDVPGVGENSERDQAYAELYASLLPELDVLLWVLKADERAYSVDLDFFNAMVAPRLTEDLPFFLVLNQVDKIEPFREWDVRARRPGRTQAANIQQKIAVVRAGFGLPESRVVCVSAEERYGLDTLVEEVVFSLPKEKKYAWASKVNPDNVSEKSREEARKGLWETFTEAVEAVVDYVADKLRSLKDAISGWFSSW